MIYTQQERSSQPRRVRSIGLILSICAPLCSKNIMTLACRSGVEEAHAVKEDRDAYDCDSVAAVC